MADEYSLQFLGAGDLAGLQSLFKSVFSNEPVGDFLHWKYFRNPAGEAVLAGAFYDGKLVASGAMIPERMQVFGVEQTIYKCTDLMTSPAHQQKGLSRKINAMLSKRVAEKGAPFSYTLCSKISTRSFSKNKWEFISEVSNFFKPAMLLKVTSIFRKHSEAVLSEHARIESQLDNYVFQTNPGLIAVKKSVEYLKWRTSNPNFDYGLLCSRNKKGAVNGYLIYSISSNNIFNIIDIDSSDNDGEIRNQLLKYAEEIALKQNRKGVVIMTVSGSHFHGYIRNRGYLVNPYQRGPLRSMLDFDMLQHKPFAKARQVAYWDLAGINYDDI